jgi:hypothetical protein
MRRAFLDALAADGVLMIPYPYGQVRAVTHYGIDAADVDRAADAARRALAQAGAQRTGAGAERTASVSAPTS